ncbi:MAG: hypothetical protein FHP92_09520 [Denitromonas halophila]|jgi:2-hydroxychromene-2-carboxylate isomerase|nr:MAG: hypothetical protein FHP92_09520 [Denitromonas halophila]
MTSEHSRSPRIDFWFDPASTYSYIAAADVTRQEAEGRARVDYRPFLLGPICAALAPPRSMSRTSA